MWASQGTGGELTAGNAGKLDAQDLSLASAPVYARDLRLLRDGRVESGEAGRVESGEAGRVETAAGGRQRRRRPWGPC